MMRTVQAELANGPIKIIMQLAKSLPQNGSALKCILGIYWRAVRNIVILMSGCVTPTARHIWLWIAGSGNLSRKMRQTNGIIFILEAIIAQHMNGAQQRSRRTMWTI